MQDQDLDHNNQLIACYLSGNASDVQVAELESWVAASTENKRLYMKMKKAWLLTGMARDHQVVDIEKAWRNTSAQLQDDHVVDMPSRSTNRRWIAIAASLIILSVASFLLFEQFNDSTSLAVNTTTSSKEIDLSDGSHVALNQSSKLTYTLDEDQQQRKVNLIGDAFFDVARDEQRPFIIETKHLEVEVLGTSFYVDAREAESQVQIIVQSGKVAVRANGSETILIAGEKVVFDKMAATVSKQKNNDVNFKAILTKTLVFENSALRDVVFALNRQFNVDIQIKNPQLTDCALTATFKDKSLEVILTILKSTLGIDVRQTQNQIIFEGSCTLE